MPQPDANNSANNVQWVNPQGTSPIILVCEHASFFIPAPLDHLGLAEGDRKSHVAWDPGAFSVAEQLAHLLDAPLLASTVSRLVYDCNRPPTAPDAMPARSEVIEVPGNAGLSDAERAARTRTYYDPFRDALAHRIAETRAPIIVTIHSFTPIYHGKTRAVEIGVLHDVDTRLADALLASAAQKSPARVERNAPYGPEHGVTHTLEEHALPGGHHNVMLEIRNDLIGTAEAQTAMAQMLADWLTAAIATLPEAAQCKV